MPQHRVARGDCLSSIGKQYGFSWKALWDHPQNAGLKEKRRDPNVLFAGDVVFVPKVQIKEEAVPTDQRHKFKLKDVPSKFRVRLLRNGKPRSNKPYVLNIE